MELLTHGRALNLDQGINAGKFDNILNSRGFIFKLEDQRLRGLGLLMATEIPGFWVSWVISSLAGDTVIKRNIGSTILLQLITIMNPYTITSLSTIMSLSITMNLSTIIITRERPGMVMVWGMEGDIMEDTMVDMEVYITDIIPTVIISKSIVITMDMVMYTVTDMNLTINRIDVTDK